MYLRRFIFSTYSLIRTDKKFLVRKVAKSLKHTGNSPYIVLEKHLKYTYKKGSPTLACH